MQQFKKYLSIFAYYVVPVFLIALSLAFSGKGIAAENDLYGFFGSIAMLLVVAIVFVKPLSQIFSWKVFKYAVAFRRQLGVVSFWFALFHGVLYIRLYDLFGLESFIGSGNTLYLLGFLGLCGMILLGVTSNNFSVKVLGRRWKQLHRLVYVIFFVILGHYAFADDAAVFAVTIGLFFALLKFATWRGVRLM